MIISSETFNKTRRNKISTSQPRDFCFLKQILYFERRMKNNSKRDLHPYHHPSPRTNAKRTTNFVNFALRNSQILKFHIPGKLCTVKHEPRKILISQAVPKLVLRNVIIFHSGRIRPSFQLPFLVGRRRKRGLSSVWNLSAHARLTINPEPVTGDSNAIHVHRFCLGTSVISGELSITVKGEGNVPLGK